MFDTFFLLQGKAKIAFVKNHLLKSVDGIEVWLNLAFPALLARTKLILSKKKNKLHSSSRHSAITIFVQKIKHYIASITRMHSIRMRTACPLTVVPVCIPEGGGGGWPLALAGGGGVWDLWPWQGGRCVTFDHPGWGRSLTFDPGLVRWVTFELARGEVVDLWPWLGGGWWPLTLARGWMTFDPVHLSPVTMWPISWCIWCHLPPVQWQNDRHLWKHNLRSLLCAARAVISEFYLVGV